MSNAQTEPMKTKVTILEWYAMGYRYPILKIIEASIKKRNYNILEQSFAYAANVEDMSNLDDELNHGVRERMQENHFDSSVKKDMISYKVTTTGKRISLSYSLASDSQLRFLVCNTGSPAKVCGYA